MKPAHPYYVVGRHFFRHYRARAKVLGIAGVIKRMRRDGVPADICALILTSQHEPAPPPRRTWVQRLRDLFPQPPERHAP